VAIATEDVAEKRERPCLVGNEPHVFDCAGLDINLYLKLRKFESDSA
jgi:hypothetical protein